MHTLQLLDATVRTAQAAGQAPWYPHRCQLGSRLAACWTGVMPGKHLDLWSTGVWLCPYHHPWPWPTTTWPPLNPPAPADPLPPRSWGRGASQEEEMRRKEKPELSHSIWFPTSCFQGGAGFRLDVPTLFDIQVAQCPWKVVYTNLLDHTEQTCSVHTPACKPPRFFGSK